MAQRDWLPGDQPPELYLKWHAWAEVQYRAGLRQRRCPHCGLWRFPQERCCEDSQLPAVGVR